MPGQTAVAETVRPHPQRLFHTLSRIEFRFEHIAEGYRIFSEELDDCIKPIIVADAGRGGPVPAIPQTAPTTPTPPHWSTAYPDGASTWIPQTAPRFRANCPSNRPRASTGPSPKTSPSVSPASDRTNMPFCHRFSARPRRRAGCPG